VVDIGEKENIGLHLSPQPYTKRGENRKYEKRREREQ